MQPRSEQRIHLIDAIERVVELVDQRLVAARGSEVQRMGRHVDDGAQARRIGHVSRELHIGAIGKYRFAGLNGVGAPNHLVGNLALRAKCFKVGHQRRANRRRHAQRTVDARVVDRIGVSLGGGPQHHAQRGEAVECESE